MKNKFLLYLGSILLLSIISSFVYYTLDYFNVSVTFYKVITCIVFTYFILRFIDELLIYRISRNSTNDNGIKKYGSSTEVYVAQKKIYGKQ